MLNVIYEEKIFEFPTCPKSNIMELKMNLMGSLDLDYDYFTFFLENYGQIDMEEMLELPLESLDLGNIKMILIVLYKIKRLRLLKKLFDLKYYFLKIYNKKFISVFNLQNIDLKRSYYLFVLNINKPDNFWKSYCAKKIFTRKDGISFAGYKSPQGFYVCYPCWIYCYNNKRSENDEEYEESENPIEAVNKECCCSNDLNKTCRFSCCPDYLNNSNILELNMKNANEFIEYEKNNFEKKKEERSNKKIWNREFDFEKS